MNEINYSINNYLSLGEIEEKNNFYETIDKKDFLTVKLAFLRNITVERIEPYLKFWGYENKLIIKPHFGNFDTAFQDSHNSHSFLYKDEYDIVSLNLKLEYFSNELVNKITVLSKDSIRKEIQRITDHIIEIVSAIKIKLSCAVLIQNFEVIPFSPFGIYDYQKPDLLVNTIRELNSIVIEKILPAFKGVYVFDADLIQSICGFFYYYDFRFWDMGKAPYSHHALNLFAKEYVKFINAIKGKTKKCIVLDCDNTLWGGIVGEEGIGNIKIGETYPGCAYRDFQKILLEYYNRGVILTTCSKNNEKDVFEVFDNHPDMILRRNNFAIHKINWVDKSENIKVISRELNISLESIVFIDDNEFEVEMVRKILPSVTSVLLPRDPCHYRNVIRNLGLFDTLSLSVEDKERTKMYIEDAERKNAFENYKNYGIEDYLKHLEIIVEIQKVNQFNLPRISQLTQRTNQFNLTTRRFTEEEIYEISNSKDTDIFCLKLSDKYGDLGIVGCAIIIHERDQSVIDTFLLSCRSLGRRIENVMLDHCVKCSVKRNNAKIIGRYIPTTKNEQVKYFYVNNGFDLLSETFSESNYALYVRNYIPTAFEYIKEIKFIE